jgi:hypothetical protein
MAVMPSSSHEGHGGEPKASEHEEQYVGIHSLVR